MSQYSTESRVSQARVDQTSDCPPIPPQSIRAAFDACFSIGFGGVQADRIVRHLQETGTLAGAPLLDRIDESIIERAFVASLPPVPFDDPAWGGPDEDLDDDDILIGVTPGEWAARCEAMQIAAEAPDGASVAQKLLDSGRLQPISPPALDPEWSDTGEWPPIMGGAPALDDDGPIPTDDELQAHLDYQRWLDSIAGIPDDQPEPTPTPTKASIGSMMRCITLAGLALGWGGEAISRLLRSAPAETSTSAEANTSEEMRRWYEDHPIAEFNRVRD